MIVSKVGRIRLYHSLDIVWSYRAVSSYHNWLVDLYLENHPFWIS